MKVKWTKRVTENFDSNVQYILKEWDKTVARKFIAKVHKTINLIANNPKIGKVEVKNKGIRGFVISVQTSLFYRINGKEIIILRIFDNRQNPDNKFYNSK